MLKRDLFLKTVFSIIIFLATNVFLILNVNRHISWLCHGKQINVPEIIHFIFEVTKLATL